MDEKTRRDFIDLLNRSNPRQRKTTTQSVEGPASADGVTFVREEMSFVEPDATARQVVLTSSRQCDCGLVLTQSNPFLGQCQYRGCHGYLCAGCLRKCTRACCGKVVCHEHSRELSGSVFCTDCYPGRLFIRLLMAFFQFDVKEKNK